MVNLLGFYPLKRAYLFAIFAFEHLFPVRVITFSKQAVAVGAPYLFLPVHLDALLDPEQPIDVRLSPALYTGQELILRRVLLIREATVAEWTG